MTSSYRFTVRGLVQGVGFRHATRMQAQRLGLSGWVRNREDGAVEGVATGTDEVLRQFHDWLRRGPSASRVDAVDWQPEAGGSSPPGFTIRHQAGS